MSINYIPTASSSGVTLAQLNTKVSKSQLTTSGVASGVVQADSSGNITASGTFNLPPISTTGFTQMSFYGDSITAGTGASPSTNRWTTVLCSQLGLTENNHGVGGTQWDGATTVMLKNAQAPNMTSFAFGANDAKHLYSLSYVMEIQRIVESCALYASLPLAKIRNPAVVDATSGVTSQTGTWSASNNPTGTLIGAASANVGATFTVTATGRFVAIAIHLPPTGTNTQSFSVTINGTAVTFPNPISNTYYADTVTTWVVDTLTSSSKTIVYTVLSGTVHDVYYVCVFDKNEVAARPVFLQRITPVQQSWGTTFQSRDNLNRAYDQVAKKLRINYGLPVYAVNHDNVSVDGMSSDGLHPNNFGYAVMSQNMIATLAGQSI